MTIPFGRHRLNISVSLTTHRREGWEEQVAAGLDDHELARLNQRNTRDYEGAPWAGLPLIYGARRRH